MLGNLSLYDNLIILIYFTIVLAIGLIASLGRDKSPQDYFLAGKNMGWLVIGMSLFATNISSEHLVGLAGSASIHGLSVGHFEWLAAFILILLGWVFAPMFIRSNVYTVPEFIGKRFDKRSRTYLAVISLVAYFFTKISVTLLAAGYILHRIIGLDMFFATVLIVLLTGIYTVMGGLNSVMKTQVFQTIVLLSGAILLTFFGLAEIGGISKLTENLPERYLSIFKSVSDPDFPWTGIIFGAPILGIWYWCTDQYIVQRILSSKGIEAARKGTVLAAILKTVPILFFIIPGLIAVELFPAVKGDEVYPFLISSNLLPSGIKGLVIAGLFAALMSSLASAFNSSATLIANDFYKPRKPDVSNNELVLVGRLATTVIIFLAISIIPLLKMINTQIYIYLQSIQAYISPPIASVFLIGIFWSKATSRAAFWALIIGGGLGVIRIITSLINPGVIANIFPLNFIDNINYLHFAIILFVISGGLMFAISLLDAKQSHQSVFDSGLLFSKDDLKISYFTKKIEDVEILNHSK